MGDSFTHKPADARRDFNIQVGEQLLVLNDLDQGLALVQDDILLERMSGFLSMIEVCIDDSEE